MKNLPPLIYGTAWKKERTAELVEKALHFGFRGIDTACQPKNLSANYFGRVFGIILAAFRFQIAG